MRSCQKILGVSGLLVCACVALAQSDVSAAENAPLENNDAGFDLRAHSHFWETTWFRFVTAASAGGVAFLLYYSRVSRLERERAAHESFTRQLLLSQENERKRMAAELHDGLGQDLLLIKNRLALLAVSAGDSPEIARQLADLSKSTSRAIADVRSISHSLRPSALEQVGLTKAIEWTVEQVAEVSASKFAVELENIDDLLTPEMEINLFRIAQEGLNNVIKHAQASEVIVQLAKSPRDITMSIFDNGQGFVMYNLGRNGHRKPCFGLTGVAERTKVLGGRLNIQSAPGQGTRLTVRVPLLPNGHGNTS